MVDRYFGMESDNNGLGWMVLVDGLRAYWVIAVEYIQRGRMNGWIGLLWDGWVRSFWLLFSLGFLLIGSLPDTPWDGLILMVLWFCFSFTLLGFSFLCSTSTHLDTAHSCTTLPV
jgi:hypothetical protein